MNRGGKPVARAGGGVAALLLFVVVVVIAPNPGHAHPYGPPPRATIGADGRSVTVEWTVAADDAFSLGEHLGLVDEGTARRQVAGILIPEEQERIADELAGAQPVVDYGKERVAVWQGDLRCQLEKVDADDLVRDGARYEFACPERVGDVDVTLTLMHDIHEAYRTFASAERDATPKRAVFTADDPTQRWRLNDEGGSAVGLGGGLAGAAALAIGGMAAALRLLRKTAGRNFDHNDDSAQAGR